MRVYKFLRVRQIMRFLLLFGIVFTVFLSGCIQQPTTDNQQKTTIEQRQNTTKPSNCDPSYPTVCIPSPPHDLDCVDIPHRNFTVLQPDPHRFDGNKDGVGCERQ